MQDIEKLHHKARRTTWILYGLWATTFALGLLQYILSIVELVDIGNFAELVSPVAYIGIFIFDMVARSHRRKYVKYNATSIYDSHLLWLIRTLWQSISLSIVIVVGVLAAVGFTMGFAEGFIAQTIFVIMGMMFLITAWSVYRIYKGWNLLRKNQPINNPRAFI
mgnify:CR=1 FL=1